MKKTLIAAFTVISLLIMFTGQAEARGFKDRPIVSNIDAPTGFTLNRGEFTVGLGHIAFGITDNVQVGTNILLMFLQDYNVKLKANLSNDETGALAAGVSLHRFDLKVWGSDSNFTSVTPSLAYTYKLTPKTNLHLSGQYSFFSGPEEIEFAEAKATSAGSSLNLGIEYGFSNRTKFLAETGYDFTFEGMRLGGAVLWGWKNFRLKLGVNYFNPKSAKSYIFPVISLWWRFNG